jgi:hypothetical protein
VDTSDGGLHANAKLNGRGRLAARHCDSVKIGRRKDFANPVSLST